MSMMWCLAGCLEFLVWFIERKGFFLIVAVIAAVFALLILKGFKWVFWENLGLNSLSLGMTALQLQIPVWAYGTPPMTLWIRSAIAVVLILLHQFPSLRCWFGIRSGGKRWQVGFWLFVMGLITFGEYVLPTLSSLAR